MPSPQTLWCLGAFGDRMLGQLSGQQEPPETDEMDGRRSPGASRHGAIRRRDPSEGAIRGKGVRLEDPLVVSTNR